MKYLNISLNLIYITVDLFCSAKFSKSLSIILLKAADSGPKGETLNTRRQSCGIYRVTPLKCGVDTGRFGILRFSHPTAPLWVSAKKMKRYTYE